jgi:hypothetical protein
LMSIHQHILILWEGNIVMPVFPTSLILYFAVIGPLFPFNS